MKSFPAILLAVIAAVSARAETAPVWELGVNPIPPEMTHGAVQAPDGTVEIGPDRWFSLPSDILGDQQNYRIEFEFMFPEGAKPGRITLVSNMDEDAKTGMELRYSPPTYNACILCVNGFSLFDKRKMLKESEFAKVCIEVRNCRASFFNGPHLVGKAGPRAKPSRREPRFGGTYTGKQKQNGSYLLRNLRIYDQLEERPELKSKAVDITESLDLFLCIGQSNMAGRAPFAGEDAEVIENCYLLNDDDLWEPARNPLNRHSSIRKDASMQKMGPSYMFARTMLQQQGASPIGLVVNAKGGTSIRSWAEGSYFYREAIRRTRIAQQHGTLRGIIWHQGETDRGDAHYLDKLQALIAALRKDLGRPDLPFVAGQVNDVELINSQLTKLPESVSNTGLVSSEGLKAMDRWHFDTGSAKILGKRYAGEMLKLLAQPGNGPTEMPQRTFQKK